MLELLPIINNNGLAFVILAMLLFASLHRREMASLQNRLFVFLIVINMVLAILDIMGWFFNGQEGQLNFWLNNVSNILLYIAAPLPAALWLLYVDCQVSRSRAACGHLSLSRLIIPLLAVNLVLTLLSLRFDLYFSVSTANIYQRGPFFFVHMLINYLLLAAAWTVALRQRENVEKRQLLAILLYPLPVLIGSILQSIWYGLALNWIAMAISVLLIFIHLENRGLKTDDLTGIYNRRHIEQEINHKIRRATPEQSFALILADLDNFKMINDLYGHKTGDEALIKTAELIRSCLRLQDQVARVGGDEFYIVLDLNKRKALNKVIGRITQSLEEFNLSSPYKWSLQLSMGAAIYDPDSKLSAEEFLCHVDKLMYKEKARRREALGKSVS